MPGMALGAGMQRSKIQCLPSALSQLAGPVTSADNHSIRYVMEVPGRHELNRPEEWRAVKPKGGGKCSRGKGTACAKAWVRGEDPALYPSPNPPHVVLAPPLVPIQLVQVPPSSCYLALASLLQCRRQTRILAEQAGETGGTWAWARAPARARRGREMGRRWSGWAAFQGLRERL